MKRKKVICLMLALLTLLLTGCGSGEKEDPHPEWDAAWFRVHRDLAAETPAGFSLNESKDIMAIQGVYYATWTAGEERSVKNSQGEDARAYDAQIYVLVKRNETAQKAESDVDSWLGREAETYTAGDEAAWTAAGQDFTVLPLLSAREGNPYHHGAAAFGVHGRDAISVELLCTENWQQDPETVLRSFLEGLHYGN